MLTYKPSLSSARQQQGVVLIAALMILTAMTVLGFTSLKTSGVQSAVSRNTQFLMSARNVANSEINGQLGNINNNSPLATDLIVQSLLDQGEDTVVAINNLQSSQTAYTQAVTMTMTCDSCPAPMGGFSFGGGGVAALIATISSSAELTATSAASSQTQGYWYLIPSN